MSRNNRPRPNDLSAEIRRQLGNETNMRYLRALPVFRIEPELPISLLSLLRQIDHAERRRKRIRP